jgi:hypothetical protein
MRTSQTIIALLAAAAGCGTNERLAVTSCEFAASVDLTEVGEIVAVARFGDGWIVGGTKFNTMRVATVDANGVVGSPSAIGLLLEEPPSAAIFRAAIRVEDTRWTAVFADADSLIGYSVDTVSGQDSTYVYAPHFTNSEPYVYWFPTAFWFEQGTGADTHIGMMRIEVEGGAQRLSSYVWSSPVDPPVELTPGATNAPPVVALNGVSSVALTMDGLIGYGDANLRQVIAPHPPAVASYGPGSPFFDGVAAAAIDGEGRSMLVRITGAGETDARLVTAPGGAVAVGSAEPEGYLAWVGGDASLSFVWPEGDRAGPTFDPPGSPFQARGPDVVRSGNDWSYAYSNGQSWFLARPTCVPAE